MRGEIDFVESFRERVALLKGLDGVGDAGNSRELAYYGRSRSVDVCPEEVWL